MNASRYAGAAARAAAPVVLLAGLALLGSARTAWADGVGTDTFSVIPTDHRPFITVQPGGTTKSSITLTNKTARPLTVHLAAIAVYRDAKGVYSYGTTTEGLATGIHLQNTAVTLQPHGLQAVAVTIDAPNTAQVTFGGIAVTADDTSAITSGVRARVVVIVEVTHDSPVSNTFTHGRTDLPPWLIGLAILMLGGLTTGFFLLAARRRRGDPMRSLVVKVTAGADAPERCSQAFTVAATALAAGAKVSLWLTGESAWLALPGQAEDFVLEHSASLAELRDSILAGGTVTLCTQCAARREISPSDVLPGVRIAGAAAFVEEILADGVQALVY